MTWNRYVNDPSLTYIRKYNLPESPPNIKTHNVQPEETGQEREVDDER